jgi:hypothetical protein
MEVANRNMPGRGFIPAPPENRNAAGTCHPFAAEQ